MVEPDRKLDAMVCRASDVLGSEVVVDPLRPVPLTVSLLASSLELLVPTYAGSLPGGRSTTFCSRKQSPLISSVATLICPRLNS